MAEEQRFDRVEKHLDRLGDKIDELTKVVTTMARIEERMVTLFKRMDVYDARSGSLDDRLTNIENGTVRHGVVFGLFDKVFWLVLGGGLAFLIKVFGE
jgi:SMC interacting uncharacterized protein involved in chromosome segregation